jgi:hypothetical protein
MDIHHLNEHSPHGTVAPDGGSRRRDSRNRDNAAYSRHLCKLRVGYRHRDRIKRDRLFHLGGLDLHPRLFNAESQVIPRFPEEPC